MCKLGDIIVVNEFRDSNGQIVPKHSFVVINDEHDCIEGYSYDFISNMMCSFHDEQHKKYKLSFESNLEIDTSQIVGKKINSKGGYIRADELYYFQKSKIQYRVIAHMENDLLNKLTNLIIYLRDRGRERKVVTNL